MVAEEQTGGFGRLGRAWASPKGGIWASIILTPKMPVDSLFMIMMAASISVARAIRRKYDLGALIKWPNDVYIGDKKVAGLLLELSADGDEIHYCLLGMGIDANVDVGELSPELQKSVTSSKAEHGKDTTARFCFPRSWGMFESRYTSS